MILCAPILGQLVENNLNRKTKERTCLVYMGNDDDGTAGPFATEIKRRTLSSLNSWSSFVFRGCFFHSPFLYAENTVSERGS